VMSKEPQQPSRRGRSYAAAVTPTFPEKRFNRTTLDCGQELGVRGSLAPPLKATGL
jgi:hypothetical protein